MASDILSSTDHLAPDSSENDVPVISPDKQFIQLTLETQTPILLSILNLVEILTIPTSQVVPMFQLPPWVTGVYNWRGDILWVVDLNHLVGFTPWYQQKSYGSKHTVIVIKGASHQGSSEEGEPVLGLIVNRVDSMVVCEPEEIQPMTDTVIPETIRPFLNGWWTSAQGKTHWMLGGEAVLSAMSITDHLPKSIV